jgi:predicted nucleic acid-binding protein
MARAKKPLYCWDTTILLAWLKNESTAPLADIALVVSEIDSKEANLIIPATVYTELLDASLSEEERELLDRFLKRSNVLSIDLTIPIAKRAAAIRQRAHEESPRRKLKTPDAQIAATALAMSADVLHSLDPDLLHLDNHPTVERLRIYQPRPLSGQRGLEMGKKRSAPSTP